ncbi:uncharacterized protein ACMZJ9_022311, partial [Mantella aurantiaca]
MGNVYFKVFKSFDPLKSGATGLDRGLEERGVIDHMTTSMRMEDQSNMTERILNLTLEIIYLLTGESYPLVKSGDQVTIMVPPPHSLKPERNNTKKILEVTQKIIGLLTGEEWEYLEGHKVLYKDVMMDNQPPLTSPDGSSNRNPPERCPRPLYSRNFTQEDLTIPHHHHRGNQSDCKVEVKEEIKEEADVEDDVIKESEFQKGPKNLNHSTMSGNLEDYYTVVVKEKFKEEDSVMEELSEEHKDLYKNMESHNGNPPERCPHPLYSQDSTQEDHFIYGQHEDLIDMKFEVKEEEEETFVGGDQQSTEEDLEMMTIDPEESSIKISTGHAMEKPSKDHLTLSPGCKMEDEDITGEKTMISSMDGGDHSVD